MVFYSAKIVLKAFTRFNPFNRKKITSNYKDVNLKIKHEVLPSSGLLKWIILWRSKSRSSTMQSKPILQCRYPRKNDKKKNIFMDELRNLFLFLSLFMWNVSMRLGSHKDLEGKINPFQCPFFWANSCEVPWGQKSSDYQGFVLFYHIR